MIIQECNYSFPLEFSGLIGGKQRRLWGRLLRSGLKTALPAALLLLRHPALVEESSAVWSGGTACDGRTNFFFAAAIDNGGFLAVEFMKTSGYQIQYRYVTESINR